MLIKVFHKTAGNKDIPTEFYIDLSIFFPSTKLDKDDQVLMFVLMKIFPTFSKQFLFIPYKAGKCS